MLQALFPLVRIERPTGQNEAILSPRRGLENSDILACLFLGLDGQNLNSLLDEEAGEKCSGIPSYRENGHNLRPHPVHDPGDVYPAAARIAERLHATELCEGRQGRNRGEEVDRRIRRDRHDRCHELLLRVDP